MTKKKLSDLLEVGADKQGYRPVAGKTYGAFLHLYKRTTSGLVLNLGIQSSKYFDQSFTGAFYLSPTFTWGYMPPGFPHVAYARIGSFLDSGERCQWLPPEFAKPDIVDAWWTPYSEDNALRFCQALAVAEDRFLQQPGLAEAVLNAAAIKNHMALLRETVEFARTQLRVESAKDIPLSTLEESAILALQKLDPQRANKNVSSFLALDAFRSLQHGEWL
jgi:hypothetical protein|uniref:hypothetical protein n=1 Tax=Prosthecobacter sp. TaxID=1965333 RepID=UPI003784E097